MLAQTFHSFTIGDVGSVASIALHVAMAGYTVAGLLAVTSMLLPGKLGPNWPNTIGVVSTISLAVFFLAGFIESGSAPLQSLFGIISLTALFISIAYFVVQRVYKMPALASFAFPAVALLFLVTMAVGGASMEHGQQLSSPLLVIHIVAIALSFGMFFLATVAALMFLILESNLKKHKDSQYLKTFPSLEALRKLVNKAVVCGLPLLTLGLVLGFFALPAIEWSAIAHNPKIVTSLTLWFILVAVTASRKIGWLHGRQHYYMMLIGFMFLLFTYVGLGVWEQRRAAQETTAIEDFQKSCNDLSYLV